MGDRGFLGYQEQKMITCNITFLEILSFLEDGECFDFNNV